MIDPATGWFEIVEIPTKRADDIANLLEMNWLTRYPWPTEIVMDRGSEFAAEVQATLKDEYGIHRKLITTRNPQANSIVERVHQVVHNLIRSFDVKNKDNLATLHAYGWQGVLAAVRSAVNSTVHTTTQATSTQLVFARDKLLNVGFQADWDYIKERKQKLLIQINKRENAKRIPHEYKVNDQVMVRLDPNRKHGTPQYAGPFSITRVNDNGTVQIRKPSPQGGAK